MRILRWLLVPVAAYVGWAISIPVGIVLLDLVFRFCPEDQIVSGLCGAWWWPYAQTGVFCVSAALAATLVVIAATLTAPARRPVVAVVAYVTGLAVAVMMTVMSIGDPYLELAAAAIAGAMATRWMWRRYRTR